MRNATFAPQPDQDFLLDKNTRLHGYMAPTSFSFELKNREHGDPRRPQRSSILLHYSNIRLLLRPRMIISSPAEGGLPQPPPLLFSQALVEYFSEYFMLNSKEVDSSILVITLFSALYVLKSFGPPPLPLLRISFSGPQVPEYPVLFWGGQT